MKQRTRDDVATGEFSLSISGEKELLRALDSLESGVRKKGARQAVTKGIRPIKAATKANVPVRYGWLKKAIDSKVKTFSRSGTVVGIIGARSDLEATITDRFGNAERIRPSNYFHLVEFGTAAHEVKLGKVKVPHPGARGLAPLRRAFEATIGAAQEIMASTLREFIENNVG